MLNLTQVRQQINFGLSGPLRTTTRLNPQARAWLGLNESYRRLKALGWESLNEMHPTDRVPLFRLGQATLRRDREQPGSWIVETSGGSYHTDADLDTITAEVSRFEEELIEVGPATFIVADPRPTNLVADHAQLLAAEYPEHAKRIALALALVADDKFEPAKYNTSWDNAGFYGCWHCDCPDSTHRKPVAKFGRACKHCLAGEILARVQREKNAVAYRERASDLERERARSVVK